MNKNEFVIVYKDKKAREVQTFVNLDGMGAKVSIHDFLSKICEMYGSPMTTMKRKTHLEKLLACANEVIYDMKMQTREVAAINLEPKINKDTSV